MKKLLILCILLLSNVYSKETVYLVEDPWKPYTIGELSQKPDSGMAVEAVKYIFQNKYNLQMKLLPWKRAIILAKNGLADGLMLTLETKKRKKYFLFSDTIFTDDILLFQQKNHKNISFNTFDDLKGLKIGVINGAAYSTDFQKAVKTLQLNVEPVSKISINIDKLLINKLDLIIISKKVATSIFKEKSDLKNRLKALDKPLVSKEFKIAISKKSFLVNDIDFINNKIKELKQSGELNKIIQKYK